MEDFKIDKAEVGRQLVSLRGDTAREVVAACVGISVSALTMYETGHRIPRDEIKMKIAAYYKVTVESIFFNVKVHKS